MQVSDQELLARLILAEGISTSCLGKTPEKDRKIFELLSYGVMNRVSMSAHSKKMQTKYGQGVRGVIFHPGQFNPAVSQRSQFSKIFVCPVESDLSRGLWNLAWEAAGKAITRPADNPFLITDWEKKKGVSLVSHFYYPKSAQATKSPPRWADVSKHSKTWVKDVGIDECIWFFRLEREFN